MSDELKLPIPDDGLTHEEALDIAYAINDSHLGLSIYAENGNDFAEDLDVYLWSMNIDKALARKKLIDSLMEEFSSSHDEDSFNEELTTDNYNWIFKHHDQCQKYRDKYKEPEKQAANLARTSFLLAMLIRTYNDWKNKYSNLTWDELKSNPLPAVKK